MISNEKAATTEYLELSVTQLSEKIKNLLESNIGYVRVKGEISGLKIATSGHAYFNLKDNTSLLACTCWKNTMMKLKFKLEEGMNVVLFGKITSYSGQSRYQLSVEKIDPDGLGAIMQILQERKARLAQEGLFAPDRKKPLPFLPKVIGVITSITGSTSVRLTMHPSCRRSST